MGHEGPELTDRGQGQLDTPSELSGPTDGVSTGVNPAGEVLRATPLPGEPRPSVKPPDAPAVRTTGPLLPMRIIGVNAVGSTANQTAPASVVTRPTPPVAPPSVVDVEPVDGSKSQRPPASIPPPKPPSGRPRNVDETPLGGVETGLNNALEFGSVSLRAPSVPVEIDQIELGPESTQELEERATPVPSGPPPLPPERRVSAQLPKDATERPDDAGVGTSEVPHLPPVRALDEEPTVPGAPAPSLDFEPPSVEVTESTEGELDSDALHATPVLPSEGFSPGPRSDRSKPPALPSRPKRTDGESKVPTEKIPSKPTHSAPSQSLPSQPAPPPPERTRQKKRRPPPIPPPRVAFTSGVEEETSKRRHWWEEVFGDDFLRANAELTERQLLREVDFIERSLNLEKSATVLDLACGSGKHSIEMNRRGYVTVGYDLSVTQLARASEAAQGEGIKVSFLQGDMREMAFDQMFDAVICWNASFGYFEEEKNVAVLKNIHRALKPGGCFLLDIPNRDFIVSHQPAQNWFEGDGCVCMDDMHVDFITSRLCVKRTIMLDDGRNKECLYSIRLFGLHELGRMLHEIGFRVNEVSGQIATRGVFMGATSPRLIITVTKR